MRTFTCMDCDKSSTTKRDFKIVTVNRIGIVMCNECIDKNFGNKEG